VDAAIEDSLAADADEAAIDAEWLARVPVAPRDPNATQIPTAEIPADPSPGRIFEEPTLLANYQLYRRLIPAFVYFNYLGRIESVAVVNTREWHFFPTGRVLVRFRNHRAGSYPLTIEDVSDSWGAYRIEPKPALDDILHVYADNAVFIETDLGEQAELTLEDGRRHLFWHKDYMILSEWAAEQTPIPCELPDSADASLMNNGLSLSTSIEPDDTGDPRPTLTASMDSVSGNFMIRGTAEVAGSLVIEGTTSLTPPIVWQTLQTNSIPSGPFSFLVAHGTNPAAYFRVKR